MKFAPKFPLTIEEARSAYCATKTMKECITGICKLSCTRKSKGLSCKKFCERYPKEAAKAMEDLFVSFDGEAVCHYSVEYPRQTLAHKDINGNWVLNRLPPKESE